MDRIQFEAAVYELRVAWFPTTYVMDRKTGQILMRYQEKSFTLPANSRPMTDEEWEAIWGPKPPATESENPVTDTVAPGLPRLKPLPLPQLPLSDRQLPPHRDLCNSRRGMI